MCASLSDGNNVKVSGFGTFILRDKGERIGRNPKTGVEVAITPGRTVRFKPGKDLKNL
jgi:integration host factor subunit alpha